MTSKTVEKLLENKRNYSSELETDSPSLSPTIELSPDRVVFYTLYNQLDLNQGKDHMGSTLTPSARTLTV